MDVKIVSFPETKIAVLEHRGSPEFEHESIKKFIDWRKKNRLSPDKHRSYGIHYNNPLTTPPEEYRVDLCISIEYEISQNSHEVINKVIPAGRCAVARHIGSREYVAEADLIYNVWLPTSNEKLRNYPIFFITSMMIPMYQNMK